MRYRALGSNGDSTFGSGSSPFLINSPAAVGQAVLTRLWLIQGEWFLDTSAGTPYIGQIVGRSVATYDYAIKTRILGTQGVESLAEYSSELNQATRKVTVNATINTIYGVTTISTQLQLGGITQ
jgi:hypothetical protein